MTMLTRAEALEVMSRSELEHRLRTGRLIRVCRGVYAPAEVERAPAELVAAAVRSTGPGLVAYRESAAILHGFGVLASDVVHLAGAPELTCRPQRGVLRHAATLRPADVTEVAGVGVTTGARTAVDLARLRSRLDGIAAVDAALRVGACDAADLAEQLAAQAKRRGIIRARDIVGLADPRAESPMESRFRLRFHDAGIPAPQPQVPIWGGRYRLDLGWPEHRVGAEYDGAVHHDRLVQRRDLARRTALTAAGWTVFWFTDVDVYRDHVRMTSIVRRALQRASLRC